jgi:hypothetical protein
MKLIKAGHDGVESVWIVHVSSPSGSFFFTELLRSAAVLRRLRRELLAVESPDDAFNEKSGEALHCGRVDLSDSHDFAGRKTVDLQRA